MSDFQVAGGLILFILAARGLIQPAGGSNWSDDFGVVPLGMPLIAGPALITTLLILARSVGLTITLVALVPPDLLLVALSLRYSKGNNGKADQARWECVRFPR